MTERLGQQRTNIYGDIGTVIGFDNNSSVQIIIKINNNENKICHTNWNDFDTGHFYYQFRTDRIGAGNINCQDQYMLIFVHFPYP